MPEILSLRSQTCACSRGLAGARSLVRALQFCVLRNELDASRQKEARQSNAKGYSSTYLAMGFANVRAGTQKRRERGRAEAPRHMFWASVRSLHRPAQKYTVGLCVCSAHSEVLEEGHAVMRSRGRSSRGGHEVTREGRGPASPMAP